jgi:hypothetical protein
MEKKIFLALSVIIFLIFHCSNFPDNNPLATNYPDSNYHLHAAWGSLPDTLYHNTQYVLACSTSTGKDTFSYINVTYPDSSVIHAYQKSFDTIMLVFKKEYSGIVRIEGVRPNGKINIDSGEVVVKNRFYAVVHKLEMPDTIVSGDSLECIAELDTLSSAYRIAVWTDSVSGSVYRDTSHLHKYKTSDTIRFAPFAGSGMIKFHAKLLDTTGFVSYTFSDSVMVLTRPYRSAAAADTTIYRNDTLTMTVFFTQGSAAITLYEWKITGIEKASCTTSTPVLSRIFSVSGVDTVIVNCRDYNRLYAAMSDTFTVTTGSGVPVVYGMNPDTVWQNSSTWFTVTATRGRINVPILYYYVSTDGSAYTSYDTSSFSYKFSLPGMHKIRVFVVDANNITSDTTSDSVLVKRGVPVIKSFTADSTVYIKEAMRFTINAMDSAGSSIDSFYVSFDSGVTYRQSASASFDTVFATAGTRYVRAVVKNSRSFFSDTLKDSITVKAGAPEVTSVSVDTATGSIFVYDSRKITVKAKDSHGRIDSIRISWGALPETKHAAGDSAVFTHSFGISDTGLKSLSVRAINNAGIYADSIYSIKVRLAKPLITGIVSDSAVTRIFINDPITFTLSVSDTNGTVDSISLDNGSGVFGGYAAAVGNTYQFSRKFTRSEAGAKMIRAIVKDDDELTSDTLGFAVNVRSGASVIDSVRIDTTDNNLFVKDVRKYSVYVSDTNGIIRKIYVSWNNGSTADDSVTVSSGYGVMTHAYDTAISGSRTIKFWAKDDDTLTSDTLKDPVVVRLAAPVLWGDKGDTVWVVVNKGYGSYYYRPNHYDTNGVIDTFYFGLNNDINSATAKYRVDSSAITVDAANIHNGNLFRYIWGRDDDSLTRGGKFVVFADSVPHAPSVHDVEGTDSITIYWSGKDAKDGDSTQYRILLKEGGEPDTATSSDLLSGWKRGYKASDDSHYAYMIKFKVAHSVNNYYYQVHARDARGSVTVCTPGHNFSF